MCLVNLVVVDYFLVIVKCGGSSMNGEIFVVSFFNNFGCGVNNFIVVLGSFIRLVSENVMRIGWDNGDFVFSNMGEVDIGVVWVCSEGVVVRMVR